MQDTGGGATDTDLSAKLLTINVTSVPDAPIGTPNTISGVLEDGLYSFKVADFGFTDPNDSPANNFAAVTITSVPLGSGSLTLGGNLVVQGQSIPVGSIPNLRYIPAANTQGAALASFTFQVQDDADTAAGGANLDPVPR